ncbi:MAG TPA: GMC oxidoreductase, partial [Burkholderiales bacterium]
RPITLNDDMMSVWRKARIGLDYLLFKKGPLTVSAGHAAAFVRTRPELKRPDAQLYFINFSSLKRGGFLHPHSGFTCAMSQMQSESRGSSHIKSPDAAVQPSIRYNYLSTERDRQVMVDGLKIARRICNASPLRDYVAGEFLPGDKVRSDEEWLAYCREMGETVFHPTSTCSIGHVVDEQLRVKGLQNLRVIDASVMPAVPSGNINAAVVALAEKAADLLKK